MFRSKARTAGARVFSIVGILAVLTMMASGAVAQGSEGHTIRDVTSALRSSDLPPHFVWVRSTVVQHNVRVPMPAVCTLGDHFPADVTIGNGSRRLWIVLLSEVVSKQAAQGSTGFLAACGMVARTSGDAVRLFDNLETAYREDLGAGNTHAWNTPRIGDASFGQKLNPWPYLIFRHANVVFVTATVEHATSTQLRVLISWTQKINSRLH